MLDGGRGPEHRLDRRLTAGPVFIWVRTSIDWSDEAAVPSLVRPDFLPKLELWNATFSLPYGRFRHEVCEIARLNLSRVEGASVREWDEIPDGALVLPVDDDDWFAPDIVDTLAAHHDADAIAYRWTSSFLEVPTTLGHHMYVARREVMPRLPPKYFCTTNNYAVIKRADAEPIAANHLLATEALRDDPCVRSLDARLSLMNRTLASQTTISSRTTTGGRQVPGVDVTRAHLVRKFRRYRKLYARSGGRAPGWSLPYVARMAELMERLELRDRP